MPKQITSLRDNVDLIEIDGKKIYLVGTAHISQSSADLAEEIIREVKPDAVAVELCSSRFESLRDPDRWKKMDLIKVLREGRAYVLFIQLMLAGFQKKMGEQLKVKPGLEMVAAIKVAEEQGAHIILADREIKTTLRRAWAAVSYWSLFKLFFSSLFASFSSNQIEEKEIEMLKTGDALDGLMKEFAEELPDVKGPLIDERDLYLASTIREGNFSTVVAIVGAGHVPGIKEQIDQPINRAVLDEIPAAGMGAQIIGWIIPALLLVLIVVGFFTSGSSTSLQMVQYWMVYTGLFAGLGALLCLAHPVTILVTIISAPITTLHPVLGVGWVAALVEAFMRKPEVGDLETVLDDMTSIKGVWTNRVARIFLIMALTTLTTVTGMILATKVIAHLL